MSVCFETLEATTVTAQFLLEPTGPTKQFTDQFVRVCVRKNGSVLVVLSAKQLRGSFVNVLLASASRLARLAPH